MWITNRAWISSAHGRNSPVASKRKRQEWYLYQSSLRRIVKRQTCARSGRIYECFKIGAFARTETQLRWTPASGAAQLRNDFPEILDVLCRILTGAITSRELARDPTMLPILYSIGGNTALNLLKDPTGTRLAHWPRSWAARTLAIIGKTGCSSTFVKAANDQEWRVRMQAVRAAGLVADSMTVDRMAGLLVSDSHRRVREAVALSLSRKGSELCLGHLRELSQDAEVSVRRAAERAITKRQEWYL